jgi:hypothetical protein
MSLGSNGEFQPGALGRAVDPLDGVTRRISSLLQWLNQENAGIWRFVFDLDNRDDNHQASVATSHRVARFDLDRELDILGAGLAKIDQPISVRACTHGRRFVSPEIAAMASRDREQVSNTRHLAAKELASHIE